MNKTGKGSINYHLKGEFKASIGGFRISRERYIAKKLERKLSGDELIGEMKVYIKYKDSLC